MTTTDNTFVTNRIVHRKVDVFLDDVVPAASTGLVVLDPPANYGLKMNIGLDETDDADVELPPDLTVQIGAFTELATRVKRVLRPGGSTVFLGEPRAVTAWEIAAMRAGLNHSADMTVLWAKPGRSKFPQPPGPRARRSRQPFYRHAALPSMFTLVKWHVKPGARRAFNPKTAVHSDSNVLVCRQVRSEHRKAPTQRPVELFNYVVSMFSLDDDLVVDPFCGSGSALVACVYGARDYLAADHNHHMCAISRRRVLDANFNAERRQMQTVQLWVRGKLVPI